MRTKAAFIIGGAVGYVLGTRAGREQFEKIRSSARTVWQDPRVQGTVTDASEFVKDKAPDLKDKVTGAVKSATGAVRSRTGGTEGSYGDTFETSTEDPYSMGTTTSSSSGTGNGSY